MNDTHSLELKISKFLRFGVLLAGFLMLIGIIIRFKWHGDPFFNFQFYDQIPFQKILEHHLKFGHWGQLISYLGLIVLISLPVLRVLLTAILFIAQKDYLLAFIAIIVLVSLALSFTLGIEHS